MPESAALDLLTAARGLEADLRAHPDGLRHLAEALRAIADTTVALTAAGILSDEALRATRGLDEKAERLASAIAADAPPLLDLLTTPGATR